MTRRPPLRRTIRSIAVVGLGKAGGSLVGSARLCDVDVKAAVRRAADLARSRGWHEADALFLAVRDDAIVEVADQVARLPALPRVVVHLSGAQGSSPLRALAAAGCHVGNFHPLASLDGEHPIPRGTLVAVDGLGAESDRALAALTSFAKRIGCEPAHVAEDKRALYHAGAVVGGNLPVALLEKGTELLVEAGVPAELARTSLARLLRSQAVNAVAHELPQALTGPVARGDAKTLERHLAALDATHKDTAALYRALSGILVDDVAAHPAAVKRKLRAALK